MHLDTQIIKISVFFERSCFLHFKAMYAICMYKHYLCANILLGEPFNVN